MWTSYNFPLNLDASFGNSYAWVRGGTSSSYLVSTSGGVLGNAVPVDLDNGWDAAGCLFGLQRLPGEPDPSFAGRTQRALIALLSTIPNATQQYIQQSIAGILGRVSISSAWNGSEPSLLPSDLSSLVILGNTPSLSTFSLQAKQIVPLYMTVSGATFSTSLSQIVSSGTSSTPLTASLINYVSQVGLPQGKYESAFRCPIDLTSYSTLFILYGSQELLKGNDYIICGEDPSILLLKQPILIASGYVAGQTTVGPDLVIQATNKENVRVVYSEDAYNNSIWANWGSARSYTSLGKNHLPSVYKTVCVSGDSGVFGGETLHSSLSSPSPFLSVNLMAVPSRVVSSGQSLPTTYLATTRSLRASTASNIEARRLRLAGGGFLTPLGQGILTYYNDTPLWSDFYTAKTQVFGPPLDLDLLPISLPVIM